MGDGERTAGEILDSIADPLVAFDKQWRYTYVNRRAAQLLGKTPEEMIGRSMWDLFPEDADTGFQSACERAWREGTLVTVERYSVLLGVWVESYIYPFQNGAATQWREITERKRAEEALRASEERNRFLADLLESADQPFGVGYPDGRLGFVNAAFERLTGYSREELQATNWAAALTPPEWRETERAALQELRRHGRPVRYEKEYLRKDGTRVPIELLVHLAKDPQGRPVYYSFVTDLTARRRAEEALRESESQFRTLANAIPQLCWMANADGWLFWYNQRWYDYTGTTPEQMEGWGWESVHDPEALPEVLERWKSSIATGEPFDMVFPLRGADGVFRPFLTRVMPVRDRDGRIAGWFGTNTDIGEQRKTEKALREERARLRLALDASNAGIWEWDVRTNQAIWSEELWKIYGLEPHSRTPSYEAWRQLVVPEDLPAAEQAVQEAARNGAELNMEFRVRGREGAERWLMATAQPQRDAEGRAVRYIGIAVDITGRRLAEDAVRQASEQRRMALEAARMGAWDYQFDTGAVFWDERCSAMFGAPAGEISDNDAIARIHPDDQNGVRQALAQALAGADEGAYRCEFRVAWPDGSEHWITSFGRVYFSGDGDARRAVRFIGVNLETTERKRAEERLRESQKLESLGLLAGGVAHDFNNLLVGVIGNASMAQEMLPADHPAAELLEGVLKTGEQAAHLTRQMLAYSGKGKFLVEALDLSAVIPEMTGLVRPAIPKKIALEFDLAKSLPPIQADRGQVQQVFMNLALNAAEAIGSREGLITVRTGVQNVNERYARLHPETVALPPGRYVYLEVRDNGCGMDEETKARIFDPFFSTKLTGRGLGLAAVAGILRGHKGAIAVSSAPGQGSCLTVLFPEAERAAEEAPVAARDVELRGAGVVLVVDDERIVLDMANRALERHGYQVLLAESGPAAIDALKRHPGEIALVVLDLSMPYMSGEEALPALRKIRPEIKVVVSSGYSESEALTLFKGQRVSGFIQKPYTAKGLAEKVKAILG